METSDVKKLKDLVEANSLLKKMYINLGMDNQTIKDLFSKKGWGPATKKQLTQELVHEYGVPVSWSCKLISIPRSQFYYETKKDDKSVIEALQDLANKHPTYGFRKLFEYLRRSGKT